MTAAADEGSLWAHALEGDEHAFAVLFDRYYAQLFRHVLRVGVQPADADEVTAATFVAFWRLRARVRVVNGSVLPWLLVTAGTLARNEGRKGQRYRRLIDRMPRSDDAVDAAEVVADRDLETRRATALRAGLQRLPMRDAQLLELTAINEVPIADAAAILGLSPGAARVRLHRARARLRQLVELPESCSLQGKVP